MLAPFKRRGADADPHRMSTHSAPGGRFRRADVVQATPEQELVALHADGAALSRRFEELLAAAGRVADVEGIVALVEATAGAREPLRAHAALRQAAVVLLELARSHGAGAAALRAAAGLLVTSLEEEPHEPELLQLLGEALHAADVAGAARRAFEVVTVLEPEHEAATSWGATLDARDPVAAGALEEGLTARAEAVLERAARLPHRRISLCMIVRDEEEMLPACLESVAEWVDELIVVDTGSVDSTRAIAEGFGATVVEFPWNGSFSDARNESLRHATGDWVLWLDADERLVVGDGPTMRELARRTWVEGWQVHETHFLGTDLEAGTAVHAPMRLFRRRPDHLWRGTVHEQVAWALPAWMPGRVRQSSLRVDHFGYAAHVVRERDKGRRNLELLLVEHEREPSAFTSFNIGTEHASAERLEEAREWFERSLDQVRAQQGDWHRQPWAPTLVQRTASTRRLVGDPAGALALIGEGRSAWPEFTDLAYDAARVHADMGDWRACAAEARRAVERGDAPARYVSVSGKGSFQARLLLARALRQLDDTAGAREQLEAAVEEAPHFHAALAELTDLLLAGEPGPATVDAELDAILGDRARHVTPNLLIGTRLHEAGHAEAADGRYDRVLAAVPRHGQALVARSELRLWQRRFDDAWECGMQVDELDPVAAAGAQSAFLAAAALERVDLLDAPCERIAASELLAAGERAVYVAWRSRLAPDAGVHAMVPADDAARAALVRNLEALARLHATDAFEVLYGLAPTVVPDAYERGLCMARLYLGLSFADMAGEELMLLVERFGPDAELLLGLGKVATIKEMWEDAAVFLQEALALQPAQPEASRLLAAVQERVRA